MRGHVEPTGLRWLAPVLGLGVFVMLVWGFGLRGSSAAGFSFTAAALGVAQGFGDAAVWQVPWPPLTLGSVAALIATGVGPLRSGQLVSALSVALTVPVVWGLGRRAGGPPAAFGAVAVFALTPRIVGLGTTVGPGAAAVCGFTLAVYALYRARRSRAWTLGAGFALVLALLNAQPALVLVPLWVLLTVTDKALSATGEREVPGFLRTSAFPLRLLAIPLVTLPVVLLGPSLLGGGWLRSFYLGWAELPQTPYVYMDTLVTAGRVPWHAGPVVLAATLPPVAVALGAAGIASEMLLGWVRASPLARRMPRIALPRDPEAAGPEAREAKRWVFGALVVALLTPWLVGTPSHAGIDLIALAIPFVAVFAGCTLSRLITHAAAAVASRQLPLPRRVPLAVAVAAFGTFVFVPAAVDCVRAHPATEAYYNVLVGDTEGAVQKGLGRNPERVAPVLVGRELARRAGDGTVGFVVDGALWRTAMRAYAAEGLCPAVTVVEAADADVVLLTHADEDPTYFAQAATFAGSTRVSRTAVLRAGALRLFTLAEVP